MPRRAATVTQADIARVIRAMRSAGYPSVRVVMQASGVTVEASSDHAGQPERGEAVAQERRVVVL